MGTRLGFCSVAVGAVVLGGCGAFSPIGQQNGNGTGTVSYGYTSPTLQITVNGVHFGPAAPDSGSGVVLENAKDSTTGRVYSSRLRGTAASIAAQGSCGFDLQRIGDGVTPIHAGPGYVIAGASTGGTPDGRVEAVTGLYVNIPQGTWACAGDSCAGGSLLLTALDATHTVGYVSGVFTNFQSGTSADVTCSFYLPTSSYTP